MGDAAAQPYPSRPITMIVPLATGGSTDVIGRIVAEGMRATLGQPVIVENVTGAGGTLGVGRVARAAPDGYTISLGQWGTNMANGAIYPLQYDIIGDFEPVALIANQPFLVDSRKSLPVKDLKELIAWLKANPDKATEGNSGLGTPSHVAGILLQNTLGIRWQMVPYRSAGLSMQDLIAGQIDILLDTPAVSLPQVSAGTIKAYAVTAKSRSAVAPDIPTVDEAGLPGFYFSFWHAHLGAQEHPQAHHRQAQRGSGQRPGGSDACASASPISRRTSSRASSSLRKRSAPSIAPRPTNGGRSSRRPASRRSDAPRGDTHALWKPGRRGSGGRIVCAWICRRA